jgi:hypothetical protein
MSLFRKIFGKKTSKQNQNKDDGVRSKYMPEVELPLDDRFTLQFKSNGGKFLYCVDQSEVEHNLNNILIENGWEDEKALIIDKRLEKKVDSFNLKISKSTSESTYFLSTCEYLIANDGSILISSNQIAEKKLKNLPLNFIIFATTSQIVNNISEGLRGIKNRYKSKIPTNITTIKHFKISDEKDFLSYGSSSKNLYLLLLEDL